MAKKSTPSLPTNKLFVGRRPWVKALLVYIASIVLIVLVVFGIFSVAYAGRVYPRVSVVDIMIGGLTPAQARETIEARLKNRSIQPVILIDGQGHSFTIKPDEANISFDLDGSIAAAMAVGRSGDWLASLAQKITTPLFGLDLPAAVRLDATKIDATINKIRDQLVTPAKNADLVIVNGEVSIGEAKAGQNLDLTLVKHQILAAFGSGQSDPISLKIVKDEPTIVATDLAALKQQAEAILSQSIVLTYNNQAFTATPATIGGWIETKSLKSLGLLKPKLDLLFNEAKIDAYVATLAAKIDQDAVSAKLALAGGQLNIIQSSKDGLKLKREGAKNDLIRLLTIRKEVPLDSNLASPPKTDESPVGAATASEDTSPEIANNQVVLEVEIIKPDITNENIASLGIKERIAVSTTDFKNSPVNRQENIRLGTKLFNGILLKPGSQFSAVKSLGRIDETAGFKPELVIKQDQLTPEIGGGLCQVSTTLFRAVLNAGLKIDERRNHRFRVSYYEARPNLVDPEDYVTIQAKTLVGLDATIYDPSPDVKFTNDTDNYILIQGRVDGTRLTFELFGTKDGRQTTIDGPYITSTSPAPTEILYIDDPTLPAGQIKIKERAYAGAKARFTYIVTKNGQPLHKNTFTSNYVPWQAKSYRGTGPAASPSPTADPSAAPTVNPLPTPEVTPSPSPAV